MNALLVSDLEREQITSEGPGAQLRTAREAQQLDIQRVAATLHLTRAIVHDLEQDDYRHLPAPVFVRGYLRNYARLLGEPVDPILEAYEQIRPKQPDERPVVRQRRSKGEIRSNHFMVQFTSLLIGLGLIGLLASWWQGYLQEPSRPPLQASRVAAPAAMPPLPSLEPQESVQAAEMPPAESDVTLAAEAVAPLPMVDTQTGEAAIETVLTTAEAAVSTAEPTAAAAADEDIVVPASEAATAATPATEPGFEILLHFRANSWVNARDATGKLQIVGEMRGGSERRLTGRPPFDIVLGKASAVALTVNGKPFDLEPHTRKNVARFSLNPDKIGAF